MTKMARARQRERTQDLARSTAARVRSRAGGLTGLGWWISGAAVAGILVGRRYGWAEFVVAGCVLALAVSTAGLMTIGRSHYSVDVDLADHAVKVGERAMGRIEVRNVGRRRLLPAQVELPVGIGSASFALPSLAAGAMHEEIYAIPTARRAVVVVGPVRSVRADPLGIAYRGICWTDPVDLYIHPQTVSLAGSRAGLMRDLEGQTSQTISENDMSFHALREYVPGDDRRNIHWRTTARTGTLMVRQFEDTRRTHTALALSTDAADYASAEEFELAVSAFASIGTQVIRDSMELTALSGGTPLRVQTPGRLLDDCSAIELTEPEPGALDLPRSVARSVPGASMVIMLTGSVPAMAGLRAGAAHIPAGVRTIFLQTVVGAQVSVRSTGVLSVSTLGDLRDLPRLVRQLVVA